MWFSALGVLAVFAGRSLAASMQEIPWTTDPQSDTLQVNSTYPFPTTFGPDGPWQAVVVSVGNSKGDTGWPQNYVDHIMPMYPIGNGYTTIFPDGGYAFLYSASGQNASGSLRLEGDFGVEGGEFDWYAEQYMNAKSNGSIAFDVVQLRDSSLSDVLTANVSLYIATGGSNISTLSHGSYANQVGYLGLGPPSLYGIAGQPKTNRTSILEQLRSSGDVGSNSFGLHIGSVSQNVKGSLVLGGYDQNRAVGPVGSFVTDPGLGTPYAFLMDVVLGGARCDSPYSASTGNQIANLYKGARTSDGNLIVSENDGPVGSAAMVPNPSYPYISMPTGTCEAIASHLPVTYNAVVGFYLWNQNDPAYAKLINSSSYLEFILSNSKATNTSIKVPFQLLNLTLEPPIVDIPTPYFPCVSSTGPEGLWLLGRAFLQAALFAMNFDTQATFLAQAPGPAMNGTKLTAINPSDDNIAASSESDTLDAFIASWQHVWPAAPDCPQGGGGVNGPANTTSSNSTPNVVAVIAGTAVGGSAFIVIVALTVFYCLRRRRRQRERNSAMAAQDTSKSFDGSNGSGSDPYGKTELPDVAHMRLEADDECFRPEAHGQEIYEAGAAGQRGLGIDHELGSTEKFETEGMKLEESEAVSEHVFELPAR